MTDQPETVYEKYARSTEGGRELAAAEAVLAVRDLLREAFKASGLSNNDFADLLGVSAGRASQILNRDENPQISTVAKALHVLGWTPVIDGRGREGQLLSESCSMAAHRPSRRSPSRSVRPLVEHASDKSAQSTTYHAAVIQGDVVFPEFSFELTHADQPAPVILEIPRQTRARRAFKLEGFAVDDLDATENERVDA